MTNTLEQDVATLMQEREEFFAARKQFLETQEQLNIAQQEEDKQRQAKGWAIDRAIETIKATGGENYKAADVIKLAECFSVYILGEGA